MLCHSENLHVTVKGMVDERVKLLFHENAATTSTFVKLY